MRKVNHTITVCYYDLDIPESADSKLIASTNTVYVPSKGQIIKIRGLEDDGGFKDYEVIRVNYELDSEYSEDGNDTESEEIVRIDVRKVAKPRNRF